MGRSFLIAHGQGEVDEVAISIWAALVLCLFRGGGWNTGAVFALYTGNLAAALYKFFIGNTLKKTALRVIITSVFAAITAHLAHSFRNLLDPSTRRRSSRRCGGRKVLRVESLECWLGMDERLLPSSARNSRLDIFKPAPKWRFHHFLRPIKGTGFHLTGSREYMKMWLKL